MEKQNIHSESVLNANREHKSSVFSMLFSDPAILRELSTSNIHEYARIKVGRYL